MSQAPRLSLRPEAADLLERACAALAVLGLSVEQAADLQRAAYLVEDAEYLEIADLDELVSEVTEHQDVDGDFARAAAYIAA